MSSLRSKQVAKIIGQINNNINNESEGGNERLQSDQGRGTEDFLRDFGLLALKQSETNFLLQAAGSVRSTHLEKSIDKGIADKKLDVIRVSPMSSIPFMSQPYLSRLLQEDGGAKNCILNITQPSGSVYTSYNPVNCVDDLDKTANQQLIVHIKAYLLAWKSDCKRGEIELKILSNMVQIVKTVLPFIVSENCLLKSIAHKSISSHPLMEKPNFKTLWSAISSQVASSQITLCELDREKVISGGKIGYYIPINLLSIIPIAYKAVTLVSVDKTAFILQGAINVLEVIAFGILSPLMAWSKTISAYTINFHSLVSMRVGNYKCEAMCVTSESGMLLDYQLLLGASHEALAVILPGIKSTIIKICKQYLSTVCYLPLALVSSVIADSSCAISDIFLTGTNPQIIIDTPDDVPIKRYIDPAQYEWGRQSISTLIGPHSSSCVAVYPRVGSVKFSLTSFTAYCLEDACSSIVDQIEKSFQEELQITQPGFFGGFNASSSWEIYIRDSLQYTPDTQSMRKRLYYTSCIFCFLSFLYTFRKVPSHLLDAIRDLYSSEGNPRREAKIKLIIGMGSQILSGRSTSDACEDGYHLIIMKNLGTNTTRTDSPQFYDHPYVTSYPFSIFPDSPTRYNSILIPIVDNYSHILSSSYKLSSFLVGHYNDPPNYPFKVFSRRLVEHVMYLVFNNHVGFHNAFLVQHYERLQNTTNRYSFLSSISPDSFFAWLHSSMDVQQITDINTYYLKLILSSIACLINEDVTHFRSHIEKPELVAVYKDFDAFRFDKGFYHGDPTQTDFIANFRVYHNLFLKCFSPP